MEEHNTWLKKNYLPCQNGTTPLSLDIALNLLPKAGEGWIIKKSEHLYLYKEFKFKDFVSAIELVNKISDIAERENHHPDLFVTWGKCAVSIWTHKVNGLTENDFILAAKIEEVETTNHRIKNRG